MLKDLFIKFEGKFEFINDKGEVLDCKDFGELISFGGTDIINICRRCVEELGKYMRGAKELEKKL